MSFGARYLVEPLPAEGFLPDAVWGADRLVVDLPGGPYGWNGLTQGQALTLSRRWAGFLLPATGTSLVECRARRVSPEIFRRFDLRGVELTLEARYGLTLVELSGYDLLARLEWSSGTLHGTLWTSAEDLETFAGLAETLCRAAVAYRLTETGAVLVHGAAVVHEGLAYVFFGPSGAGKTTLSVSCAAEGDVVVSDDLNALTERGGRFVVEPMPFCGDLGCGSPVGPAPVAALCRLRQASVDHAEPLGAGQAVAALAACAPFVNRDPFRTDRLLTNVQRAAERIPCRLLSSRKGSLPWKALRASGLPA